MGRNPFSADLFRLNFGAMDDGMYHNRDDKLAALKYLYSVGCPIDDTSLSTTHAAMCGDLDRLKYLCSIGCPVDENTCRWAAMQGQLECLQYLRSVGCPWDERTIAEAGPSPPHLPYKGTGKTAAAEAAAGGGEEGKEGKEGKEEKDGGGAEEKDAVGAGATVAAAARAVVAAAARAAATLAAGVAAAVVGGSGGGSGGGSDGGSGGGAAIVREAGRGRATTTQAEVREWALANGCPEPAGELGILTEYCAKCGDFLPKARAARLKGVDYDLAPFLRNGLTSNGIIHWPDHVCI